MSHDNFDRRSTRQTVRKALSTLLYPGVATDAGVELLCDAPEWQPRNRYDQENT